MSDLKYELPLKLNKLNKMAKKSPNELIKICEDYYKNQIDTVCKKILSKTSGRRIVMLSGPSSSGKTTTAHLITDRLKKQGINSKVISLDDFYKGIDKAPKNPDGSYDYESVQALNIDLMQSCLNSIVEKGCCSKPIFDFTVGRPKPRLEEIVIGPNDTVIVEGIHALNPLVVGSLPQEHLFKIYITVKSTLRDENHKHVISRRGVRLSRRILRDFKYRSSNPTQTLEMWNMVEKGENRYLFPFEDEAEYIIDSFHPYELCIMKSIIMPCLSEIDPSTLNYDRIERLIEGYKKISPLPLSLLPKDSLLMEFLG